MSCFSSDLLTEWGEKVRGAGAEMTGGNDPRVIPQQADAAANANNIAAIDRVSGHTAYRHIVAWGKFLGFTPETVLREIALAERENAPVDAIQKLDGRWHTVADIAND